MVGEREATIEWALDAHATGVIEYGETPEYGSRSAGEESFRWDRHRQTIEELSPATTYHYRVHSAAREGGVSSSERAIFTTASNGPTISDVRVSAMGENEATIEWSLDAHATGVIEFGETPEYGSRSAGEESFRWDRHRQTLSGLSAGTTYHYRVRSADPDGGASVSADATFTTVSDGPLVSDLRVSSVGEREATIEWNLDRRANGFVEYGETLEYGSRSAGEESFRWERHRQTVGNLSPATRYHYRVHSADRDGKVTVSEEAVFTTASDGPLIDGLRVSAVAPTEATIEWTLDDYATGVVEYGETLAYGSRSTGEESLRWDRHRQTIGTLSPGTRYHYRVRSIDREGRVSLSADAVFTTPPAPGSSLAQGANGPVEPSIGAGSPFELTPSVSQGGDDVPAKKQLAERSSVEDPEEMASKEVASGSGSVPVGESTGGASASGPRISEVRASEIGDREATIEWSLDRHAGGIVEFGETTAYGSWSHGEGSLDWDRHRQTLDGLRPGTTYHYRVHSTDAERRAAVSADNTFMTMPAPTSAEFGLGEPARKYGSGSSDGAWPDGADEDLPYGGIFYGASAGGIHLANAWISEESSRRFRAERTGEVKAVRYQNRVLLQENIDSRCKRQGPSSRWCKCKQHGLDAYTCGYTLGSSYSVGNGGLITIQVRPDDGNGNPGGTVLGQTRAFVPYDLPDINFYPQVELIEHASLEAGQIYHLVYKNARPPIKCKLGGVPLNQASKCDRDRGAIGLNGPYLPHTSTTTGKDGPWRGSASSATLVKRGDKWVRYGKNLMWFELAYTDGVNVGDSYSAHNVTKSDVAHTIQGSKRARQSFTVRDATRRTDGAWLNFGHTKSADGSSLSVTLRDESGDALAKGSIRSSSECRKQVKSGASWAERDCRDWGYASFDKVVPLIEGQTYSIEFSGSSRAGFVLSSYESLSVYHTFDDRNQWRDARAELSTNGGHSWGKWTSRMAHERDLALLFTIEGMPRQMP